jgi:hypothetical protein
MNLEGYRSVTQQYYCVTERGRAAFTHAAADFDVSSTAVRLFNDGGKEVHASNVSVDGVCMVGRQCHHFPLLRKPCFVC